MSGLLAENRNKYEYFLCQAFHTIPNKTEVHMQTDWEMLSCRMFYDPSYLFR